MNASNRPQRGEFYMLEPDVRSGGPGHSVMIANEEALLTPPSAIIRPRHGGIPVLPEVPRLAFEGKRRKLPNDLDGGFSGYWLVSQRLKDVFVAVDPEAFAFAACEFVLPDGSRGPQYYLCDVVRKLAALDKDKSDFRILTARDHSTGKDVEIMNFSGGASLFFRKEVVGDAHVFRMGEEPSTVICDKAMRDATRAAGIGAKASSDGLWFIDAAGR